MNEYSANEHVPEAERNSRTIKERARAVYHSLPFKSITRTMMKHLVMDCAWKLNCFPFKNGISEYYSPREIVQAKKIDYRKHLKIPMFLYVQAHEEPAMELCVNPSVNSVDIHSTNQHEPTWTN